MKLIFMIIIALSLISCLKTKTLTPDSNTGIFKVEVNQKGYVPSSIKVSKRVNKVKLLFTRTTDKTCAREVILEEQNIHQKLPLNQEVEISFDLNGSDEIIFGCHMDKMFSGRIIRSSDI